MEAFNAWCGKWEPSWLFLLIGYECVIGTLTFAILVVEYHYDKVFNDQIKEARRNRRRKKYEFENLTDGECK